MLGVEEEEMKERTLSVKAGIERNLSVGSSRGLQQASERAA